MDWLVLKIMQNRNKLYWTLQLCGWGLIGLVMLFFAHAYNYKISTEVLLGKIAVVTISGILTTHLLRLLIKKLGWLMLPIEKAIPRFILAMVATSMIYSLIVLTTSDLFSLGVENRKVSFAARFAGSTVDNGLFITKEDASARRFPSVVVDQVQGNSILDDLDEGRQPTILL